MQVNYQKICDDKSQQRKKRKEKKGERKSPRDCSKNQMVTRIGQRLE